MRTADEIRREFTSENTSLGQRDSLHLEVLLDIRSMLLWLVTNIVSSAATSAPPGIDPGHLDIPDMSLDGSGTPPWSEPGA